MWRSAVNVDEPTLTLSCIQEWRSQPFRRTHAGDFMVAEDCNSRAKHCMVPHPSVYWLLVSLQESYVLHSHRETAFVVRGLKNDILVLPALTALQLVQKLEAMHNSP